MTDSGFFLSFPKKACHFRFIVFLFFIARLYYTAYVCTVLLIFPDIETFWFGNSRSSMARGVSREKVLLAKHPLVKNGEIKRPLSWERCSKTTLLWLVWGKNRAGELAGGGVFDVFSVSCFLTVRGRCSCWTGVWLELGHWGRYTLQWTVYSTSEHAITTWECFWR